MAYLTAEQARQKADESDAQYKLLKHEVFINIESAAHKGKYNLEITRNIPYSLSTRLVEELRNCGYSADCDMINPKETNDGKRDMRFRINWKY